MPHEAHRYYYSQAFALYLSNGAVLEVAHACALEAAKLGRRGEADLFDPQALHSARLASLETENTTLRADQVTLEARIVDLETQLKALTEAKAEADAARIRVIGQAVAAENAYVELSRALWPDKTNHRDLLVECGIAGALIEASLRASAFRGDVLDSEHGLACAAEAPIAAEGETP